MKMRCGAEISYEMNCVRAHKREDGQEIFASGKGTHIYVQTDRSAHSSDEICCELSLWGYAVCILAGLAAEIVIFLMLGLQTALIAVPVLLFLWFLLTVLTAGVVTEAAEYYIRIRCGCPRFCRR